LTIANIGPRERRKRLGVGLVAFGISVALGAALIVAGVAPRWRLVLVLPLFVAALGYFQARAKT
jgi:hypothetical protein